MDNLDPSTTSGGFMPSSDLDQLTSDPDDLQAAASTLTLPTPPGSTQPFSMKNILNITPTPGQGDAADSASSSCDYQRGSYGHHAAAAAAAMGSYPGASYPCVPLMHGASTAGPCAENLPSDSPASCDYMNGYHSRLHDPMDVPGAAPLYTDLSTTTTPTSISSMMGGLHNTIGFPHGATYPTSTTGNTSIPDDSRAKCKSEDSTDSSKQKCEYKNYI